jgi:DNA-binding MarR family transcriptional regulator
MGDGWMSESSPFDHAAIDDVIHGRLRLGMVAYLSSVEDALFTELRDKVGATDGNLSAHLRKLEEAAYVRVDKSFVGRKPQTRVSLTAKGRRAWSAWLDQIEALTLAAGRERQGG